MSVASPDTIAVIGAGASGLASLKECLAEGLDVVCFDQEPQVGGLWRYVPQGGDDTHSSVYMSTIINTSKEMMAYSDFPAPKEWPTFLPHRFVVKYLNSYCDHFKLREHIKFNRKVISVPHKSYGGRFRSVSRVRSKCETFDYVIIATGHHWKPKLPEFKGMENFEGGMLHSHSYKVPYPFKDQRVLIVGIGNSGADIATELSHHAKQVILSARSGQWILPRSSLFGVPLDHLSTRLAASLPRPLTNYLFETAMKFQNGDLSRFGLKPKHGIFDAHPTVNGHILDRIAAGKILVRPNVAEFAATTSTSTGVPRTNTVVFEDGTVEQIDQVIYCTGYKIEHPFLSPQTSLDILGRERPDSNRVRLYKNVFPVFHKNIAFVGLVQPIGAVMPVSEMQARWVSRVFSGNPTQTPLPSPTQMRDEVDINWTHNYKPTHVLTERHTIQVDFVSYMDDIATQIGCKPDLWGLVRGKEFVLASQILLGPAVPAQYRVNGPGRWEGAKGVAGYKAVERLREREKRGEKGAGADETAHDALVR
ncbi:flavin-containing monooxygenase [Fimicolochytrium jonesii]|uniref:flavin-containing monooxygenase n=1 Tax=Fimicolochytrium jonesii TaxID=1396493 RepID=UPI0022FE2922|nr:flavin-containing monooxygenase [Fimicolochytrium jonesii]KAI8819123.1 flavin-containing monooxygenase [Fimicolochytrium jonesii]